MEFIGIQESKPENSLRKALIGQMKKFVLELGKDYIFVDKEFRLQVGNSDFFVDLLLGIINASIQAYFMGLIKLNDRDVYDTCHQFMHGIFS